MNFMETLRDVFARHFLNSELVEDRLVGIMEKDLQVDIPEELREENIDSFLNLAIRIPNEMSKLRFSSCAWIPNSNKFFSRGCQLGQLAQLPIYIDESIHVLQPCITESSLLGAFNLTGTELSESIKEIRYGGAAREYIVEVQDPKTGRLASIPDLAALYEFADEGFPIEGFFALPTAVASFETSEVLIFTFLHHLSFALGQTILLKGFLALEEEFLNLESTLANIWVDFVRSNLKSLS